MEIKPLFFCCPSATDKHQVVGQSGEVWFVGSWLECWQFIENQKARSAEEINTGKFTKFDL